MKNQTTKRVLCLLMVIALLAGFAVPVSATGTDVAPQGSAQNGLDFTQVENIDTSAAIQSEVAVTEEQTPEFAATDMVRVSIILDGDSTIDAGFSTLDIAANDEAMAYRATLASEQADVTVSIERAIGNELDVRWNLTLAANIISANVQYGQIETITAVEGVKTVVLENRYEPAVVEKEEVADPNMSTSGTQIGSLAAWANGYTGIGSRIAVIDTGVDTDHQSFAADAYQYSLVYEAGKAGMGADEYIESLNLLDKEEIASVLDKLNRQGLDADSLYVNAKIPFGYNYVDADYDITHDNDGQGEHGSHVTGIAAANAYIPTDEGGYEKALTSVLVQGVAPDAQIIAMKVFGKNGGAYDSDYMAAIEDAIVLGCDSVNLSLGTVMPGFSFSDTYAELLEGLQQTDTVVVTSASNNAGWATYDYRIGYLYGDEVSFNTAGAPGSYYNTLSVASVDNAGTTGYYFQFGDELVFYNEYLTLYRVQSILSLAGETEYEYIFIDGIGSEEDFAAVADVLEGKIAFCSRGTNSFYQKANAAVANGAIATVIYNNQPGVINMDMTGYRYYAPAVSITQDDGARVRALSTPVTDDEGNVRYYTGKMTISTGIASGMWNSEYNTISSFSSWGVPGSLILKPEITAPGGSIYSVNGLDQSGTAYETMSGTSMASPQVAGMVAVMAQYIRENEIETDLTARGLAQSLLMSTAVPMIEEESGNYYPVLRQGSGLANVGNAISANTYIQMGEDATYGHADGKVKVELGDDPQRNGSYSFSFTLNDLTGKGGQYTLSSDFFTQDMFSYDGEMYLDTWTATLPADVTYTVDGKVFVPTTDYDCDLDGDGDTDADDAQIILNYVAGLQAEIDAKADLDASGAVTSYDAYLLLANMETATFTVPQDGKVEITVKVELAEEAKAYLDTYYTVGAYVEGFVFVNPQVDAEGAVCDVTHSIPVLGFYGNWSDSSMYEDYSLTEYLYGEPIKSHTDQYVINNLIVKYPGSSSQHYLTGNPYFLDDAYHPERLTLSSKSTIYRYSVSLIRNASAIGVMFTDEDGNILYNCGVANDQHSSFYWTNWGMWADVFLGLDVGKKLSVAGAKEGDLVNISAVAVPEYYRKDAPINKDDLQKMVEDGILGDGAFLTTTVKIDDTAPVADFISKDLATGNLIVSAHDNNYLSAVLLYNEDGTELLAAVNPNQQEAGQNMNIIIDLEGITVRERCMVVVADYANNKSTYVVEYGGEPEDFGGRMFGFTTDATRGDPDRWMEIDPEKLFYGNANNQGGMTSMDTMDFEVKAAEYVGGYVFMADDSGNIFVAEHGKWSSYIKVGSTGLTGKYKAIYDMAYNYSDNQLYALGYGNVIYTIDITTGKATKQYTVTIKNPEDSDYTDLYSLAIDGEGTFYAVNVAEEDYDCVFLYKWTKNKVSNGTIKKLAPVNDDDRALGRYYAEYDCDQSLAWDHNTDKLYFANADYKACNKNYLLVINPETGRASKANQNKNYLNNTTYDAITYDRIEGMYIVPAETELVPPAKDATGIDISKTSMTIFRGQTSQLKAFLYPWTLEDQTVTWTTDDATVATVDADGYVKGTGLGTTTITATSNASPDLSISCEVTVEELENMEVKGLVHDADGNAYWSEFDTSNTSGWTAASEATGKYLGGGMLEGKLITHDGRNMYEIDPDSFATRNLGSIALDWIWSDATEMPGRDYLMGKTMLAGICSDGQYLEMVDPYAGSLSYFDFSQYFETDPMATIIYWGDGVQSGYGSQIFRVMTESGKMYEIEIWIVAIFVKCTVTLLGETGLNLSGASSPTSGQNASMIYDAESEMYLLSKYTEGEYANLYAIDPETMDVVDMGNFGAGVHPVVSLYQYMRYTELTVLLNTYTASIYEKEQIQLTADVKPLDADKAVVWASSDESIATVDQNGLVTAHKAGTVNITATTKQVDEDGIPGVGTCELTVLPLVPVNMDVNAQIQTADGKYQWINFNTANITDITVKTTTSTVVEAGTGHAGLIHAKTADGFVKIDPNNGYTSTSPVADTMGDVYFDMGTAPYLYTSGAYVPGIGSTGALMFGQPVFVSQNQIFGIFIDYDAGTTFNFSWYDQQFKGNAAAVCYSGETTLNTAPAQGFTVLCTDGNLYAITLSANVWNSDGSAKSYVGGIKLLGNIGMTFSDRTKLNMAYVKTDTQNGYLIADSGVTGDTMVYFVNVANGQMKTDLVGRVPGAVDMTTMYTTADMNLEGDKLEANPDFAIWDGTATRASSFRSIAEPNTVVAVGEMSSVTQEPAGFAKESVVGTQGVDVGNYTVSVAVTEDEAVTNGLYEVTYDPTILTYKNVASTATLSAVKVDAENGKITFAFASKTAFDAKADVAVVNFTYAKDYVVTNVTVKTLQRNTAQVSESETTEIVYEVGGHDYQITESSDATCLEDGYQIFTCTKCGDSYRVELPAAGHDYKAEVTMPTCTSIGYTTYTCANCGDSYMAEKVDALGHDYEAIVTPPTCTEYGYTTYTCTFCEDSYVADYVEPQGHHFGEWETVTDPGCEDEGQQKRVCTDCGETEYRDTDPIGHIYEAIITEPTCTEAGFTTNVCEICGDSYIADVKDPVGHTYEAVIVDPTCTEPGYTTYICECGESYVSDYVEPTGHTYGEWVVTTPATCAEDGTETRYCEDCDAYETRAIAAYCPSAGYADVKQDDWFHEAVDYVVEGGIMEGVSATEFAPHAVATRAQLVTVLYRMEGQPSVAGLNNPFTDIADDAWYTEAVLWAYANGITTGTSDTTFTPNASVTREQVVAFLYRYAQFKGEDVTTEGDLSAFADADTVSDYAVPAMIWAVENGIITGMTETTLVPAGTSIRAQIAMILMRFMEN